VRQRRPDRIVGGPHDEFWAHCAEGRLCLQACRACGRLSWPAVEHCPYCAAHAFEWQQMSGAGRLASWCTFERPYYGSVLPCPWETILVELVEGPLFVSNPQDFSVAEARLDMPMRVAFVECEDAYGPPILASHQFPAAAALTPDPIPVALAQHHGEVPGGARPVAIDRDGQGANEVCTVRQQCLVGFAADQAAHALATVEGASPSDVDDAVIGVEGGGRVRVVAVDRPPIADQRVADG
jgi:uncharacterized OB-fold protein